MSISIEEVFAAVFADIYTYDSKYKELKSNTKLNVMNYPYPLRRLIYDNYYMIHDLNKDCLTLKELEEIKDKDPEVKYIRNLRNQNDIFKNRANNYEDDNINVFNHLTEEDYNYINSDDNDRKHTSLKFIVKYNKSVLNTENDVWNINYYYANNIQPINNTYDNNILYNVIDYENLNKVDIKYITYSDFRILVKRFVSDTNSLFDLSKHLGIYSETVCFDKMNTLINEYIQIKMNNETLFDFDAEIIKYRYETIINYYLNSSRKLDNNIFLCSLYGNKEEIEKLYNKIYTCYYSNNRLKLDYKDIFIRLLYQLFAKCYKSINDIDNFAEYFDNKYDIVNYYMKTCRDYNIAIEKEILERLMKPYYDKYYNKFNELKEEKYNVKISEELDEETQNIIKDNNRYNNSLSNLIKNLITDINNISFNVFDIKCFNLFYTSKDFDKILLSEILAKCVKDKSFKDFLNVVKQGDEHVNIYEKDDGIYIYACFLYKLLKTDIDNNKHDYKEYFAEIIEMLKNEELYKDNEDSINYVRNEWVEDQEHTLGYCYIKAYKCVPLLEIYTDPEFENLANIWENMTSFETPLEMTNKKYYDYMIKNNGKRRPSNITAIYSYFSNTAENKLIFIQNDETLDKPAKLRYIIPIEYEKVKEFITEDLDTNNICIFTTISNNDWKKIANDNDRIDVVAFSDIKNVYKERTNFKKLIEFFKDAIEMKFDCKLTIETDE